MSGGVPAGEGLAVMLARLEEDMKHSSRRTWMPVHVDYLRAIMDAAASTITTPTPPIEGRDADVERATTTLDVFLAAYRHRPDHKLARPIADDDLLTWGDLRTILAALQALGERG